MDEPIRIISDLHLGHPASLAREIGQVEPLFDGAGTVIFNGDTIEMRSERSREVAQELLRSVQEFCAAQAATSCFINGNHDPIISTTNHLELGEGSLLVTHGDVLLHDSPRPKPRGRRAAALALELPTPLEPAGRLSLEQILSTNKRGADGLPMAKFTIPNGAWGQFSTFMRQTWPPRRFVSMVSTWKDNPVHAVDLVRQYRPLVKCVTVGHTHFPGVWHHHGNHVINTGSYLPVFGRLAVDFADGVVTVRKVVLRRGRFHLGRQVARFRLNTRTKVA